jgi:hypothetical protein
VVYDILLLNYKKYSISYKKISKNKFYASFQFYFLCIFLVGRNLVSKYEQLLILTGIDASTLLDSSNSFGGDMAQMLASFMLKSE